jgi:uncharacterized membrane-anchored protein YhcB (DUF1043 family)
MGHDVGLLEMFETQVRLLEEQVKDNSNLQSQLEEAYEKVDQWWDERDRIFMKCI